MTLEGMIKILSRDGINSKKKAIEMLSTDNVQELLEFKRSICEKINKLREADIDEKNVICNQ